MKIDPHKILLLVIDMQKDFYAEGGNAVLREKPVKKMQALLTKINEFAAKLRNAGAKVVFTKFVFDPRRNPESYKEIIGETRNSSWMCEVNTEGAELAGVRPSKTDTIMEKLSYDCFAGTDLLRLCLDWSIETVVITGVRTEVCVLHTACRSFAENFRTVVISDLVGTYDNKAGVAATILHVLQYSGYVMTGQEFEQMLIA